MKEIELNQLEFEYLLISLKSEEVFVNEKLCNQGIQNIEILDGHEVILRFVVK